jgi:hypothetical protein
MKRFKRPISEVAKGLFHQSSSDSKPLVPNLGVNSKKAEGDSPLHMNSPAKRGGSSSSSSSSSGGKGGGGGTPKKVTYEEAYKKRDMKTYGNLNQEEYTKEAKRQTANKKKTSVKVEGRNAAGTKTGPGYGYTTKGSWDAPKSQMKGSVTGPKTEGGDANNKQVVGVGNKPADKKVDVVDSKKNSKVVAAKKNLKQTKKDNKVEKINAKAEVASAKGKNKRADRLKARAERKETGKSKKDQGRNIFGRKTKAQKAKEAAAAAPGKYGKVKK